MTAEQWERVKEAVAALLECEAGERAARLEELEQRDPAVHREVVSLLEHEQSGSFLDRSPVLAPEPVPSSPSVSRVNPPHPGLLARDKLILATLLPIFLVVFGLHVVQVNRTGLAEPPLFVATTNDGNPYPRVRGLWLEEAGNVAGLQIGDRLLRVGDADLRGVGHIGFDALAIEQAGQDQSVTVEFERDGRRAEVLLPLTRYRFGWRIPFLLAVATTAVLVLLRGRGSSHARSLAVAFLGFAISQAPFHGGSYFQSYASNVIFYASSLYVLPLLLRWAMLFPPEAPRPGRLALMLPWLLTPLFAFLRGNYFVEGPIPGALAPTLVTVAEGLSALVFLGLLTLNFRRSDPIGRRRLKWVLYGFYIGMVPVAVMMVVGPLVSPQAPAYRFALSYGALMFAVAPIGILIAIVRHQLFDIDRLISVTASYSLLLAVFAGGALTIADSGAGLVSRAVGMNQGIAQFFITVAIAAVVLPAHQWLRPAIERTAFPERRAFEDGIRKLLDEISALHSPAELSQRVGESLTQLLRPGRCVIYARTGSDFTPVFVGGTPSPPPPVVSAESPLISVLERRSAPVAVESASGRPRRTDQLAPFERATLEELGVSVVVPIRGRHVMEAFLCLGAKRSGDVYTSTDIAWLVAVCERFTTTLVKHSAQPWSDHADIAEPSARPDSALAPRGVTDATPESPPGASLVDFLVECSVCGLCYSSAVSRCEHDGGRLIASNLPRTLADRYRLDRRLGRGGMGTVYQATDTSLRRIVAVKVVRGDLAGSDDVADRFRREARTTAGFMHPHAVTVHDFGIATTGAPFFVMERLEGRTLGDELRSEGCLGPSTTLEILGDVCAVVEAAHRRQLVHRDLKPANIFLARTQQDRVVKVLDFGLAKYLSPTAVHTATQAGALVGTVPYMAPERFHGGDVSPAWDIWSLAVIAYEMLAGQRPFEGQSSTEIQLSIVEHRVTPITARLPDASADLQAFFDGSLAADAAERPHSAESFLIELGQHLTR